MALPTTQHPQQMTQQHATQGVGQTGQHQSSYQTGQVGQMGAAPAGVGPGAAQTPTTEPAKPVLFSDIDPVLLVRLYPHAASGDAARADAEKAGQAAYDLSTKIIAAQQEPVAEVPAA